MISFYIWCLKSIWIDRLTFSQLYTRSSYHLFQHCMTSQLGNITVALHTVNWFLKGIVSYSSFVDKIKKYALDGLLMPNTCSQRIGVIIKGTSSHWLYLSFWNAFNVGPDLISLVSISISVGTKLGGTINRQIIESEF